MKRYKMGSHQFMAIPAFTLFFVFFIYPLIKGIGMSFTDWDGIGKANFIGFQNFIDFFKDKRALSDIRTTVLFALGSAPLLNIIGLLYALLLNSSFKGKSAARMCIYMPAIISPLIMGYIWYLLLQPGRGFLFHLADQAGHPDWFGNWMGGYGTTMLVLILVNVWQYAGMTMVIYLAGLQGIPKELYEAAEIDGAGKIKCFRYVTLPLLGPSVRINVITNIIGSLSVFDIVMSLTGGGPGYQTETLSIYIMRMCYGSKTGYSTAVAMIMFVIVLIPVAVSLRLMKEKE
ncbi:MAG: sugar ABC transporter permease [Clostridiales bacterium]|nr:sugar ABC transporter permease [Clostridiales bacterium]MDU3243290.1 sugar ABC transporter permease [Clostridiales bacterium]